jgi:hypothetical protein
MTTTPRILTVAALSVTLACGGETTGTQGDSDSDVDAGFGVDSSREDGSHRLGHCPVEDASPSAPCEGETVRGRCVVTLATDQSPTSNLVQTGGELYFAQWATVSVGSG